MKKSMLDSSDVFIMDLGLKLFQYNGATANKDEKYKAVQYMQDLKSKRPKADTETLEENELVSILYNSSSRGDKSENGRLFGNIW